MLQDELGARIRARRERKGLKQLDLANALQVSPQAVSKWERGENAPDLAALAPLARLLGVSTDFLLTGFSESLDTFEATVFASSIMGAYRKSRGLDPADFAAWVNGVFHPLTEIIQRHDGVPVKYVGDGFLGFFSGPDHKRRALESAFQVRKVTSEDVRIGLSTGSVYLGAVGHPDYARPDIMGETVNLAFLTLGWAEEKAQSGIAATQAVLAETDLANAGLQEAVNFKEVRHLVNLAEILEKQQ